MHESNKSIKICLHGLLDKNKYKITFFIFKKI